MNIIQQYQAKDDKIFTTKKDCIKYELLIDEVEIMMKPFGKVRNGTSFANGEGYLQHNLKDVVKAKKKIMVLGKKEFSMKPTDKIGFGMMGRYLDDSGKDVLNSAWHRLNCIDDKGREWGQPYFALNPHEGKQKQLN